MNPIPVVYQVLIALVPFLWTPTTSELFEFPKMLFVYGITIVLTSLWLYRIVQSKKVTLVRTFLDIPLLLFFLSQLLSTLFSINHHTSIWGYYSRFNGGFVSTLCYILLYYIAVNNLTKKDVGRLVNTLLISTGVAALYAFLEHFGYSLSCLFITDQFNAACWVQDVQTRVFGTFGQPNWLAAYLISLIFIPLAYLLKDSKDKKPQTKMLFQIGYWLLITLFFLTLLFTKSRSGILGFAGGMIIFSLLNFRKLKLLILVYALVAFCYLFFGKGIIPQLDRYLFQNQTPKVTQNTSETQPTQTVEPPALEGGGTQSSEIRKIVWQGAIDIWKKYPLFGSGVETFAYSYYNVRPVAHNLVSEWDFLYNKAHNEFLNYLSTTGLFGLLAYLGIIFTFCFRVIKHAVSRQQSLLSERAQRSRSSSTERGAGSSSTRDCEDDALIYAFISGFIALAVSNFFGFSTVPVNVLFYLFPAFAFILTRSDSDSKPQLHVPHAIAPLIGIVLVSGYVFLRLISGYIADITYNSAKKAADSNQLAEALLQYDKAIKMVGNEPTYHDAFSIALAEGAAALYLDKKDEQANQFMAKAIDESNKTIALNPVHVNFWKTRARLFITLTQLNPGYVQNAQQALLQAIRLAPTDAKLWYNLGLLYDQLDQEDQALLLYQKTVELKPDYEGARMSLAALYEASAPAKAKEQYRYILDHINPNNPAALEKIEALK